MTNYSELESITCVRCHRTSFDPGDIAEGYCGYCHDRTGLTEFRVVCRTENGWGWYVIRSSDITRARKVATRWLSGEWTHVYRLDDLPADQWPDVCPAGELGRLA